MAAEEAPAAAAPVKAAVQRKRKPAAATKSSHGPSIPKLILEAVADDKGRRGTSLWAIKKFLGGKGLPVKEAAVNRRINKVVVKLVDEGKLVQVRGRGASGSFKIPKLAKLTKAAPKPAKLAKKAAKKTPVKVRKPAVKKLVKKKTAAKKTTTKKSPKKAAKKSAAKKSVKKLAVKKPAPKKAAKKSPAKKVPAKKAAKKSKK